MLHFSLPSSYVRPRSLDPHSFFSDTFLLFAFSSLSKPGPVQSRPGEVLVQPDNLGFFLHQDMFMAEKIIDKMRKKKRGKRRDPPKSCFHLYIKRHRRTVVRIIAEKSVLKSCKLCDPKKEKNNHFAFN